MHVHHSYNNEGMLITQTKFHPPTLYWNCVVTRHHSCYLDIEDSLNASVLPLPGEPAFTQEEEDLLRVHVKHLHLVQVPVGTHHAVIMPDFYLENLSEVDRLYSELIHLAEIKT